MAAKKSQVRSANLFFAELIIVLLFFSISAAVILSVFAAADNKQKTASLTENSIICAQSLAECYSVNGDLSSSVALVFGEAFHSGEEVTLTLDEQMACSEDGAVQLSLAETVLSETEAGRLSQLEMIFSYCETQLYTLTCTAYCGSMKQEVQSDEG